MVSYAKHTASERRRVSTDVTIWRHKGADTYIQSTTQRLAILVIKILIEERKRERERDRERERGKTKQNKKKNMKFLSMSTIALQPAK